MKNGAFQVGSNQNGFYAYTHIDGKVVYIHVDGSLRQRAVTGTRKLKPTAYYTTQDLAEKAIQKFYAFW